MAVLETSGLDSFQLSMEELANLPDSVLDEMLLASAQVVEYAQKRKGRAYGVHRTGVTLSALTHGKAKRAKEGRVIHVYPRGRNADGNSNAEVAFINEYGKRGQPARPFIRDANEESADEAVDRAEAVYHSWLDRHNL